LPLWRKQGSGVLLVWAIAQTSKAESSQASFYRIWSGNTPYTDHGIWMGKHHVQKINKDFGLETQEKSRSEKRGASTRVPPLEGKHGRTSFVPPPLLLLPPDATCWRPTTLGMAVHLPVSEQGAQGMDLLQIVCHRTSWRAPAGIRRW
jgi:hypothetical protein